MARTLKFWIRSQGLLLAIAVQALLLVLAHGGYRASLLAPIEVLMVVLVAASAGTLSAIVSAAVGLLYTAYSLSRPGTLFDYTQDDWIRLLVLLLVTAAACSVVGELKRRFDASGAELEAEAANSRAALQSKGEFMNAAAHELRTPLTVISGYISMLEDGTLGVPADTWGRPLRILQDKVNELAALVDEMLISARIEAGNLPAARVRVDLREAVRDAVERAGPHVTVTEAALTYELPSQSVMVDLDCDHLAHILDHLISNAINYSDRPPSVKITVRDGGDPQVRVEDRGWGVPEAMRKRIFERFERGVDPAREPRPGTGLGLAISRELAQLYGGSLELVRSDVGEGSAFLLRLPRAASFPKVYR